MLTEHVIFRLLLEEAAHTFKNQPVGMLDHYNPRQPGVVLVSNAIVKRFQNDIPVILLHLVCYQSMRRQQSQLDIAYAVIDPRCGHEKRRAEMFVGVLLSLQLPCDLGKVRIEVPGGFTLAEQ